MKKLLLASTVLAGVAFVAAPAHAAVKLDLGGFFRGYGVYADNNEAIGAANSLHKFELRRDTEVHVNGETTLDNGLTVGFHTEQKLGGATITDEAYSYFSGGWGRVNLGSEDGSAYLLQVGAPSADSNVDGLRTYIQAVKAIDPVFAAGAIPGTAVSNTLDYDQVSDPTGAANTERLTYLTPKFNGFQAGVSFAPTVGQQAAYGGVAPMTLDKTNGAHDNIWEGSARWDGEFSGVGLNLGGGYSHSSLENHATGLAADAIPVASDGIGTWNGGLGLSYMGFSLGGSYLRANTADTTGLDPAGAPALRDVKSDVTTATWVGGLGYDNGPYHVGGSYLHTKFQRDGNGGVAADAGELSKLDATVQRYTVGGGYTFGPGMTFRGAVAWGKFDNNTAQINNDANAGFTAAEFIGGAATNNDFTQVTVGTDIQF